MATSKQRIRVLRAFRHRGESIDKGSVLDLDLAIAIELRSANKVEFVQSDTKVTKRIVPRRKPRPEPEPEAKKDPEPKK